MKTINDLIAESIQSIITKHILFAGAAIAREHLVNNDLKTAATNGTTIEYNEEYFNSLSFNQRSTLICHELLHILLGHHLRMRGRDIETWNSACDYVINLMLGSMGFEHIPNWLFDTKYKGMSCEDVYAKLIKKSDNERQKINERSENSGGSFNEPKGSDGKELSEGELNDKLSKTETEARNAYSQINRRINSIKKSTSLNDGEKKKMLSEASKGFSEIRERLTDYTHSRIDWKSVVRNFLFCESQTEINEESFDFYVMESQDFDIVINDYENKSFGKIAFCTDVSGSLSHIAKPIASEAFHALNQTKNGVIKLYQISDRIHTSKEITNPDDIPVVKGDGTNFDSFFNGECLKSDFDARGIIFVTDGIVNTTRWVDPEIPVLWILTRANEKFEKNIHFGDVIRFNN